ncbi:S-acyl fatty acid synthase thioesterase, medium chain-like [Haliotis rufescens]|uniref:S-acyl fatty acid synthase thioesterase, medium chain-like n=1 Tax=Haliotis rufescens TaxID=6454 RepID=UPI00201EC0C0|nr:S-acyl fatty acid synthase thioesterase, medium chain-like [Haliotis rufescens]XP_046361147.2 S-acyl fatty acid synthase thioesterase, medium chain-like [Haliotis rufescens]
MACERLMNCRFKRPSALYRLICLPWAGGGSSFYAGWGKLMSENIEVVGVTLPGRESRFNDKCCDDMEEILTDITNTITSQYMDKPFILWGHSMGSLLAFELACRLKSQTGQEPKKMYLSGISAPHSPMRKKVYIDRTQTDQQFIVVMSRLGGTPKEVLENEEMMKIFLPCIRADYTMLDGFTFTKSDGLPPLSCPISFFDGEDDSKHDTEAWRSLTSGQFSLTMMPGGHFYLRELNNMRAIISHISRDFA